MKKIYKEINVKFKDKEDLLITLNRDSRIMKLITFLNPFSYKVFLENPELIHEFDCFFADGALLVKLHNIFNQNKIDRVSFDFSSIAKDVLEFANNNKLKIALIGATQDELDGAVKNLKNMYSNINFCYTRNGYFNNEDDYTECFDNLKNIKMDILIIGMGSPYQEKFAVKVKKENSEIPLVFTCGGFLTQTSIKTDYYHPLVKKFGLRWLQRAIMHKHVRNRLIKDYPIFTIKYIANSILLKIKLKKGNINIHD